MDQQVAFGPSLMAKDSATMAQKAAFMKTLLAKDSAAGGDEKDYTIGSDGGRKLYGINLRDLTLRARNKYHLWFQLYNYLLEHSIGHYDMLTKTVKDFNDDEERESMTIDDWVESEMERFADAEYFVGTSRIWAAFPEDPSEAVDL